MAPRKSTRRGGKQKEEAKKKDATAVEATNARAVTNDDGTTDDDNDGWTLDHHLVGSTCPTPRLILCPIDSSSVAVALGGASSSNNATAEKSHADDYYSIMQESIQAAAFQPENRMQRKPALGRCLVHGNNTAVHAAAALKEQQQEKEEETKPAAAEEEYCLSVDCLSCDWQPQESSSNNTTNAQTSSNKLMCVPTWHNISMASERIQTVVLDHVMHKVLANLVMVAAIEEIRSHYLRQAAAELLLQTSSSSGTTTTHGGGSGEAADVSTREQQHHSRSTSTNIGGKSAKKSNNNNISQLPPRYYSMAPNSYLSPPTVSVAGKKAEQDASSNINNTTFVLPVQFTPNQLVHRIKQGCSMLYKANQEKLVLLQNNINNKNLVLADNNAGAAAIVAAAAASGYNEGIRTSSRRIARLQTTTTPIIASTTTTTTITTTTTTTGNAQEAAVTADPGQVPEDWKVRQGGTVAAFLNDLLFTVPKAAATVVVAAKDETLENNDDHADNDDDDDNDANMKEEQPITEPAAEPSDGKADGDKEESEDVQMSSEEEEKSKEDKDDDEDYSPKKDDEEDEDDEEVQADTEEESLEVAESEVEEEEEADDGEEEEDQDNADNDDDDENVDVVNESNPYLQPTSLAILDWLGRKTAKLCSSSDLQTVFPELLLKQQPPPTKKGKNSSTTTTAAALIEAGVGKSAQELLSFGIDRVIWEKMLSTGVENSNNFSIGSSARLVLQSVSHEKIADLDEWDTAYFGRSPFNLRIVDESLEEAKSRHSADDIALAELAYKEQKAWDQQRYKGIHGGYTTWPSWTVAATAWRTSVAALGEAAAGAPTQPSAGGGAQQQQQELSENDQTIAQELAKEEDHVGKRRATRRGGDTAGVFYGKNSNMSQKQLMDTILRLVSNRPMGTLMGLISAIADDSADPLRRMRISLGRLLWKRNQIARRSVHTEWTDQPHWNRLAKGSILSVITNDTDENGASNYNSILEYVRGLHKTELQLRSLVVKHLTDIPISIIAAAADERQGSLESVDDAEFGDPFSIEWQSSGHELLNKFIFRPSHQHQSDSIAPCYWYRIQGFVPSIAATYEEGAGPPERPQIGSAKDTIAVERRVRFRVVPAVPRDVRVAKETPSEPLVLTEGQVRAGLKAAEMERKQSTKSTSTENPFTEVDGSRISLIPTQSRENVPQIEGLVTGHNTVIEGGIVTQKIQVLPDEKSSRHEAFWATLKTASDGSFLCCIGEDPTEYSVRQFDYDSSSIAFQQCREVIEYLRRQSKAAPFLEPVDPVALNIPHYFDVIKNPMDISTLSQNLEKGVYSIIPPGDAHGTSPVTRMLNGPFRDDLELIMDNAIMFNPPDDWIYKAAVALKKMALKKIENLSHAAEGKSGGFTSQKQKSVYVDEDSDVDMYVYESDQDDDYDGGGSRRTKKRKRASQKPTREDSSTKAIEKPIRLQNVLSDSVGLRGAFSNIPINSDAFTFSLPPEWTSRHSLNKSETEGDGEPESIESSERGELDNLISMHLQTEEKETANLRRSTRAHHEPSSSNGAKKLSMINVEYECDGVPGLGSVENPLPRDRLEVELAREKYHEMHYAKNYLSIQKRVEALAADSNTETGIGLFSEGSFPPYMGRVVPEVGPGSDDVRVTWELRAPYLVPAVRWVLRGLIQSEHLAAMEELPTDSSSGGVIVANHAYHLDPSLNPFEIVDQKELQRRKRANQEEEEEESEEEIELNEYEKLRAARVARNAERLKALGLA